jgi:DNA-directed RNA polymerase subunit RPC12/RpoP
MRTYTPTYVHPLTGELLWRCPHCGHSIRCQNLTELDQLEDDAACEGCRARELFERNPEMIGFAVDMWARLDAWPQSSVWMEAIPLSGISVLGAGYHAIGLRYPNRTAALSWTAG